MVTAFDSIRLGTSESNLTSFGWLKYALQLPEPSVAIYNDHSTRVDGSDGSQATHGYKNVQMNFNDLDRQQAYRLKKLVDDAGTTLWVTFDKGWNGSSPPHSWVDGYGVPKYTSVTPRSNTRGIITESVTLYIDNVTIDNDPATGI